MMMVKNEPSTKQPRLQGNPTPQFFQREMVFVPDVVTSFPHFPSQTEDWANHINVPVNLTPQLKSLNLFSERKQREFIPDSKKDDSYWDRRRRNNEAARRSRQKRRLNDLVLESKVLELTKENIILRAELGAIRDRYCISTETLPNPDKVQLTSCAEVLDQCSLVPSINSTNVTDTSTFVNVQDMLSLTSCLNTTSNQSSAQSISVMRPVPKVPSDSDCDYITNNDTTLASLQSNTNTSNNCPTLNRSSSLPPLASRSPPVDQESVSSPSSWSSIDDSSQTSTSGHSLTSFSLPHKLRHKFHLGEREKHHNSLSPTDSGRSSRRDSSSTREDLSSISSDGDSTGSNDNHSLSSTDIKLNNRSQRRSTHKDNRHLLQTENSQLRSELQRLASEVENLLDVMIQEGSQMESDGQHLTEEQYAMSHDYRN
ncbi:uncharacterized protein LOC143240285 [Tachypleus tridentatus]|uniref:uncharacterized protein LOC143240285 n=1 Tax=Tachypleus tridentatus TaxID=6853 RepID=UPI003FD4BD94